MSIILGKRAGIGNAKELPFTISSGLFAKIFGMYRLPKTMVQSIHGNNGSLAYFVDYDSDDELSMPSHLCTNPLFPFWVIRSSFLPETCFVLRLTPFPAVVVQTPYSPFQDFSVVARINILSGSVISILFDNTEEDLNVLIKRLRWRCKQTHQCPLSLLAILFEGYGYTSEECRRKLDADVVSLEVRTGMTSLDTNPGGYSLRISDYEKMMRDLHACNTNLIFLANVLNFEMEFGTFCGRLFEVFEELRERSGEGKFHTARARDEFQQHLAYCMDSSRFRQKQTQSLRMRVKSQINVVSSLFTPIYTHSGGRGVLRS